MDKLKIGIVSFFAVITSWLGTLALPVYILVACNVIDYITGITAACVRKEQVSSYKGIVGIAKKVFMYLLILVGVFVDLMLQYMFKNLNIPIALPFIVGCIVACWLVLNEMLSILENLNDIGVPMPPFLIRGTVEKKGEDIKDGIGKKEEDIEAVPQTRVEKITEGLLKK